MPRAVVDPGVFVSALLAPHGTAGKLLDALFRGQWQLVASPLLFEELTDVLLRERFHRYFDATQVYEFIAQLITVAVLVEDPIERPKVTQDPQEQPPSGAGDAGRSVQDLIAQRLRLGLCATARPTSASGCARAGLGPS
ncbi:MAG: putative toxin-antitoxin system toxin component, PIN family [Egibacteraceae bacterium]